MREESVTREPRALEDAPWARRATPDPPGGLVNLVRQLDDQDVAQTGSEAQIKQASNAPHAVDGRHT